MQGARTTLLSWLVLAALASNCTTAPEQTPTLATELAAIANRLQSDAGPNATMSVWLGEVHGAPHFERNLDERYTIATSPSSLRAYDTNTDPAGGLDTTVRAAGERLRGIAAQLHDARRGHGTMPPTFPDLHRATHPLLGERFELITVVDSARSTRDATRCGWWTRNSVTIVFAFAMRAPPEFARGMHATMRRLQDQSLWAARRHLMAKDAPLAFTKRGSFERCAADEPMIDCAEAGAMTWMDSSSLPLFAANPKRGQVVADIGCGYGGAIRRIVTALEGDVKVLGRDPDERVLVDARENDLPELHENYAVSKFDDVCIAAQSVDLAFMVDVVDYVLRQKNTQAAFARSLFEALRPGGELVIIDYEGTREQAAATDQLFRAAGFLRGRKFRIWNKRTFHTVYEYLRPVKT